MPKIGIVGAGLSGLTCAWRLAQKGIKTIVFEKETYTGGRVLYSGAISSGKFDFRLNNLIKELDLKELAVPLKPNEIGFYTEKGEMLDLNKFLKQVKKTLSLTEGLRVMRAFYFINTLNLDVENPDPKLIKLREISFEDFLKKYPPKIAKILRETACFFGETEEFNPKRMSAEYGLSIVRLANELQSGKAYTFEENNILTLTNVLVRKIEEKGTQILTLAEVKKIEKEREGFKVFYTKEGEEKIEGVDEIVLATPLNITKEIFPQLNLDTDINYPFLKTFFVKGEFKYPKMKVIKGNPRNPANFIILYNLVPEYQLIHCLPKTNVSFEYLYYRWEIIDEKMGIALPIVGPRAKVPDLKTKIKGAYLAGDFYYHTFMEVAVATAEMVAKMIKE